MMKKLLATTLLLTLFFAAGAEAQEGKDRGRGTEKTEEGKKSEHPCDGDVWCGLFAAHPGDAVPVVADRGEGAVDEGRELIVAQLRKAFPDHGHFRLIGENTESIFKEYECWIVPARQLFLKIDSLGNQPDKSGGVHVHLQLWQEDHVLLKSDTILRRQPVFIAGPKWGETGQLIMVLKLKQVAKEKGGE